MNTHSKYARPRYCLWLDTVRQVCRRSGRQTVYRSLSSGRSCCAPHVDALRPDLSLRKISGYFWDIQAGLRTGGCRQNHGDAILAQQGDDLIKPVERERRLVRLKVGPAKHRQRDDIDVRQFHQPNVFIPSLPRPLIRVVVAAMKYDGGTSALSMERCKLPVQVGSSSSGHSGNVF